ncbi:MAG: lytic murein transglycosylase B, partial [Thiothrix sp.]
RMQRTHGFDAGQLQALFANVQRNEDILAKASKPAEGKPWFQYRSIFLTEDRINNGIGFWRQYASAVEAAAQQYGVDPAYIVAIIGVETLYGRNTGNYYVLQALTTLAFDFPKRADFYQKELEQYLLLTREEQVQPFGWQGSYAGAMGLGQFISSSYRQYAQDFNRDGRRNLWDPEDAIGSVANYLAQHGWQTGEDVAVPAYVSGQAYARLLNEKPVKPSLILPALTAQGIVPVSSLRAKQASLILLDGAAGSEFWLGGDNFYVITRYNHSNKYAMAVHQLAQAIRQRMRR